MMANDDAQCFAYDCCHIDEALAQLLGRLTPNILCGDKVMKRRALMRTCGFLHYKTEIIGLPCGNSQVPRERLSEFRLTCSSTSAYEKYLPVAWHASGSFSSSAFKSCHGRSLLSGCTSVLYVHVAVAADDQGHALACKPSLRPHPGFGARPDR